MGLTADFGAFSAIGSLSPHSLIGRFNHPPPEQADLYKALPPREKAMKPKTWTTVLMPFEGTYVPCFVSRAEHEEGIVGLSTGMSSSPLDKGWASKIGRLNANHQTVIAIGLHHTADFKNYYGVNRRLIEAFFFDQSCSPLYSSGDRNMARTAMTHSTSSALFLDTISRPFALDRVPETLTNAIHLNPLVDTYHSSKGHYRVNSILFDAFMMARGSHDIGDLALEKWIIGKDEIDGAPPIYGRPECSRIRLTRQKVREFSAEVFRGERMDVSSFPQKMYLGERDKAVCIFAAEALGRAMGVETQRYDSTHYSMLDIREALSSMLRRINTDHFQDGTPRERAERKRGVSSHEAELLGLSGLSHTLEGGAGALDTFARFA
ncbi:MAG: hypothetical protein GW778_07085 [Alphaproteobacteria bacterium]|nr:hypothetical protein [Alphaproteobacteria bacterium]